MSFSILFSPPTWLRWGARESGWVGIWHRLTHYSINHKVTFNVKCVWAVVSRSTFTEDVVDSFRLRRWYCKLVFQKEITDFKWKPLAPFSAIVETITVITWKVPHISIYVGEDVIRKKDIFFSLTDCSSVSSIFASYGRSDICCQVLQEDF